MTVKARKPFVDADGAARELAAFARGLKFPCVDKDAATIAQESASSPWIKYLARRFAGSAEAYLRWALANVPKMAKSSRYVINQAQFDLLVRRTGIDLFRSWRESTSGHGSRLSFGATYRIVDLLFKAIDESELCRFDSIRQFLHVPLDGTTLKPLRPIIDELHDTDFSLEIPATIPPGFVATEEHYILLQAAISALSRRASIPPIAYAYWCERG